MSTVAVVIVTSDHASHIKSCLESVLNAAGSEVFDIVVVDNASEDGTPALVRREVGVRLIERLGRQSLSCNLNLALKTITSEYVLIMNPDVVVDHDTILGLESFMTSHPDAGACGPQLVSSDGSLQFSCRRFPTPWTAIVRRTPLRLLPGTLEKGRRHLMVDCDHTHLRTVDWILGACVMFRTEALQTVGWFDERYRLYCEDIDICHSLWANGWSIYYNPSIVAMHEHLARSDKAFFSRYFFWHVSSMFRYVRKHGLCGFSRPIAHQQH
jgi:GT2 family glycosyltransferase